MLKTGVTTMKIMNENYDISFEFPAAVACGEVARTRLLVAGPGLSLPGDHGSGRSGVAGVGPLHAAVRACADHIKIFTTGGVSSVNSVLTESSYSAEEIAAIVDEAAAATEDHVRPSSLTGG